MTQVFAFEGPEIEALQWMPFEVRRKLDLSGVKLSLSAWEAMPLAARRELLSTPIDAAADVPRYHALALRLGQAAGKVEPQPPVPFEERPWLRGDAVFARVRALGLSLDEARWGGLPDLARYALHRLADPKKSQDKLRAALAELVT